MADCFIEECSEVGKPVLMETSLKSQIIMVDDIFG